MNKPDPTKLVGRLLGPAAAEVGCDTCFDELDRYVELERTGRDAEAAVPGLRAHLEGCPACREEYESLHALLADDGR
jgi:predicted anti-sigma-YlaC factor YlaD